MKLVFFRYIWCSEYNDQSPITQTLEIFKTFEDGEIDVNERIIENSDTLNSSNSTIKVR